MVEAPDPKNPKLRGAGIAAPLAWLQETYGPETFLRVLREFSPDEEALFRRGVVSISWYPLLAWERVLLGYQHEATRAGATPEEFRVRLMREGGGRILQTLYRFIFSMLQPQTILSRLFSINQRIYDQGGNTLLQNESGLCRASFFGPAAMYEYTRAFTVAGMHAALEMTGSQQIQVSINRDERRERDFIIEASATYLPPS